jgi:uncharacterized protein (DUF1697 family)
MYRDGGRDHEMRYIAFLRAVNVGGRFVTMERLRAIFEDLGLTEVRSFIQSGNIFFESRSKSRDALTKRIEARLHEELGYEVATFVRTVDEVAVAIASDPFADVDVTEHTRVCVVFVRSVPRGLELPLRSPKGEIEIIGATSGEAFVVLHQKPGRPVNAGPFLEKTFRGKVTVRFYGATQKILAAAQRAS